MSIRTKQSRRAKVVLSSAALAAISMAASNASAQYQDILTQWNFDAIGTMNPDNSPAPTTGSGTATALGMTNNYVLSDGSNGSTNSDDVTGSNPMDPSQTEGPGNTYAWRVRGNGNGGGNGWSNSAPQYSQGAEFDTSTAGYSGIEFSCDMFCTNQGIHTMQEQYTTDGSTWNNFGSVIATVANGYLYDLTMNFSGSAYAAVNNDSSFGVRLVACYDTIDPSSPAYDSNSVYSASANGSTVYNNSSGNWRFANVTFSYNGTTSLNNGAMYPVLTWSPTNTTWNATTTNWTNTNGVSGLVFGGTSTIGAFTDSILPTSTSTATVSVNGTGVAAAGVMVTNTNGTYTFTGGPISGGAFVKTGGGNVVLSQGSNSNTFNGLSIQGGTLHTASDAFLGAATSTVTVNGGTLVADADLNIAHNILVGSNGGDISSNFSVTSSGSFALQGAFVKIGSGDINFTNAITSSPGSTFSVMGGNVTFSGTAARTIVSTPASGTTFAGNIIINNSKGFTVTGGNVAGPGQILLNKNNSEFTGDSITGTTYTTVSMPIVINSGTSTSWSEGVGASGVGDTMILEPTAVISGNGNIINSGGKATLIMDSQSTYTGNTTMENDAVGLTQLGVNNAFPVTTNLSFGDGTVTTSIGAIDLNGYNQQLASLATNLPNGSNRIAQFANGITNSSANLSTITISGTASTVFNAVIGTPTGVILANAGNNIALTLAASNTGTLELQELNTYVGTTTINGGTLQFDAAMDTIGDYTLSSMPVGANVVNNASLVINSPDTVAGNISGTGTTTVNGTSLSYIQTLLAPALTANNMVQGALVNNGTTTINVYGNIGSVSGSGSLVIGTGNGSALTSVFSLQQSNVTLASSSLLNIGIPGGTAGPLNISGTLNVSNGAVAQFLPSTTAHVLNTVNTLNLNNTGLIDLSNSDLSVNNSLSQVRSYLAQAYAGGAWTGTSGITSSVVEANPSTLSIAYVSGANTNNAALNPALTNTSAVLLRPSLIGDFNLDGKVDRFDIRQFNARNAFNDGLTTHDWADGDLNGDGKVDRFDIRILNASNNFNSGNTFVAQAQTLSSSVSPATGNSINNPTTVGTVGDGKPDLIYNPSTGDVVFSYDGYNPGTGKELVEIDVQSSKSDLNPSGANTSAAQFVSKASNDVDYQDVGTGIADGVDLGTIMPVGSTPAALTNGDIVVNLYLNGEGTSNKYADITSTPEPTTLSLMGLAAAGLLGRRRKPRQPQ